MIMNDQDGNRLTSADFLKCIPKEKKLKNVSLNVYEGPNENYSKEEANHVCDALLALPCSELKIGVGGKYFLLLPSLLTKKSFVDRIFRIPDCLQKQSSRKLASTKLFFLAFEFKSLTLRRVPNQQTNWHF